MQANPAGKFTAWLFALLRVYAVNGSLQYNAAVMIAEDLLRDLVCPACIQPVDYRENPESLKCQKCQRVYAVKDDIPIMLLDEATIEN